MSRQAAPWLCLSLLFASAPALPEERVAGFVPLTAEGFPLRRGLLPLRVYEAPDFAADVVGEVQPDGSLKTAAGREFRLTEIKQESLALPVVRGSGEWLLAALYEDQFPWLSGAHVSGWVHLPGARPIPLERVLREGNAGVVADWDGRLFVALGGSKTRSVEAPGIKSRGMARFLYKPPDDCRLPVLASPTGASREVASFCSLDAESTVASLRCYSPEEEAQDVLRGFCREALVLAEKDGWFQVLGSGLQGGPEPREWKGAAREETFGLPVGWMRKELFEPPRPVAPERYERLFREVLGDVPSRPTDVEILQSKPVGGQTWLRVRVTRRCAPAKRRYFGEGWLPLWTGSRLNFVLYPKGC